MYNSDSLFAGSMLSHKVERQWWFKISEVDEWIRSSVAVK